MTGYRGTERLYGLVIVREGIWTDYSGRERKKVYK